MPWFIELALIFWSALSVGWLLIAWCLVAGRKPPASVPGPAKLPALTIFKPLPPLSESGKPQLRQALESFIAQAGEDVQILLGIPQSDQEFWDGQILEWKRRWLGCRLQTVTGLPLPGIANPKISWQRQLALHATHGLWLWSDADILIPPGFLDGIRAELAHSSSSSLTCPYVVRDASQPAALFDTLFVDVEFFPGVLLLGKRGPVPFALGAGTLFHAEEFKQRADWEKLGSTLADDNELGRQLRPIQVSGWVVETLPFKRNLLDAWAHYFRWHKTVRWCEPLGYAGQAFVLPLIGWLTALAVFWTPPAAAGAAVTVLLESTLALAICRSAGCRVPVRQAVLFPLWPVVRMTTWLLSWLPTPVVWSGCKSRWWGLRRLELFSRVKST